MSQRIFISGGAGFIGSNAAFKYAKGGHLVTIFDDLSRKGSKKNLEWMRAQSANVTFIEGDVRNTSGLGLIFRENAYDVVLHLAAQVAVTTSVANPLEDHAVNVHGTLSMLEAVRHGRNPHATFIFSSTNKVYGALEYIDVDETETRYTTKNAVDENYSLDFHSPYGCSKGAADQYVRDYARTYGMYTIVMRQSCIYGERQMGIEDQGWVAWIMSRAALGLPAFIYGTGKQVRDLLYVGDLLNAFDAAVDKVGKYRGQIYNLGGGNCNTKSIIELMLWIRRQYPSFTWKFDRWRPGDQKIYISDISKAERDLAWKPKIGIDLGLNKLMAWVEENKHEFVLT